MEYSLLLGDNRAVLDAMPAKSIHLIATSPPYFGLRAYAGDQQIEWPTVEYAPMPGLSMLTIAPMRCGLGNEPTLEAYIGHLILCLRSWHRVLRDDGCCFVNLGDSFANDGKWGGASGGEHVHGLHGNDGPWRGKRSTGLKPKDLCLVPARFALAAQADGWYVRSRIIWAKGVSFLADYAGSCMPESVTDRPTKSDEDIYLLTKQPKYFWDQEAVKEKAVKDVCPEMGKTTTDARRQAKSGGDTKPMIARGGRSLRSVWAINPQPYPGAHFACWPPALVEPMIKAATSEHGVCANCGSPWERNIEKRANYERRQDRDQPNGAMPQVDSSGWRPATIVDNGWIPTCACNAAIVPATVLDPFSGSGTTGAVACSLGRDYIGIDLSTDYVELAHDRIREAINESGRARIQPVAKEEDMANLPLFA